MPNLADVAQLSMDLFYQDYKTDENFFSLEQIMALCGVAYAKLLEDEYKEARREAKQDEGLTEIYLQSDWLVKSKVTMKQSDFYHDTYVGDLPVPLFSFPYDPYSFGVQSVRRVGDAKCRVDFIRTTERESWMKNMLPVTSRAFYYLIGKQLYVFNSPCPLTELEILQVPEITDTSFGADGGPIPASKQDTIIRKTLDLMMRARDGVLVDMSNDSNPNKSAGTELDTNFRNLKTNP